MAKVVKTKEPNLLKMIVQDLAHNWWFHGLVIVSVGMMVFSLISPPPGQIHSSVISASSEILAMMALGIVLKAVNRGIDAIFRKGDVTVEIKNDSIEETNPTSEYRTEEN